MKNWNYIYGAEVGNEIPNIQINGPSAAEIREIAGRVYKTDMRKDDLARAVSFELAKKYKSFQTNSHIMDMVSEVLSKFKVGNSFNYMDYTEARLTGKWTDEQVEYVLKNPQLFKKEVVDAAKKEKGKRTGNSRISNSTWYEPRRMPFQPRALRYAYEQAKKKGLSGQKLEAEMLRIVKTSPHDSAATESEMRKDVSEWVLHNGNPEDFVNNKGTETGNAKVINSDREFFKELADDAKKREDKDKQEVEKLAGNARYTLKEDVISHLDTDLYDICKKVPAGSPSLAYVRELQKIGWDISTISKYNSEIGKIIDKYKKVGNSKVGNAIADKEFNTKEELKRWCKEHGYGFYPAEGHGYANGGWYELEDTEKKGRPYLEARVRSEVGNSIGGGVQSETVLTEAKDGSQYWVEKTSKSGQYAQYNLYYTIGQGKRHAGVFKDKESAADAGRRIIGNSSSDEEYWKKQYIEAAKRKGVPEKEIQEFVKKIEKEGPKGVMSIIKNSSSDDKFAYVMREFDEGKLKTPDGKVVTDPAQAKAIAYSESKKAENGLTRARNAIKK